MRSFAICGTPFCLLYLCVKTQRSKYQFCKINSQFPLLIKIQLNESLQQQNSKTTKELPNDSNHSQQQIIMAQLWEWNLMTRHYMCCTKKKPVLIRFLLFFLLLTPPHLSMFLYLWGASEFHLAFYGSGIVYTIYGHPKGVRNKRIWARTYQWAPFYNLVHVVENQIEQVLQDAVSKRNTWDGTAQNTSLIYHSWLFFFDPSNKHIAVNIHYYYYHCSF